MTNGKQKIKQKALESLQQIIDGFLGNEEFPNESLLNDPDQELKKAHKGIAIMLGFYGYRHEVFGML